jgi:hypothetical protein
MDGEYLRVITNQEVDTFPEICLGGIKVAQSLEGRNQDSFDDHN